MAIIVVGYDACNIYDNRYDIRMCMKCAIDDVTHPIANTVLSMSVDRKIER